MRKGSQTVLSRSSTIRPVGQLLLRHKTKNLSSFYTSRGLSRPYCEISLALLSVSSFLLPFSLLASIFLLDDFPSNIVTQGPFATRRCQQRCPAASLSPDIAVETFRCQYNFRVSKCY